jgi:hypothetical protein
MSMKFLILIIVLVLTVSVKSDSVCSAKYLIDELTQDFLDNKKLDCLYVPLSPPNGVVETDEDKKLRLNAVWDSDCAFETDYNWLKILQNNFGMKTGIVDKDGKAVEAPIAGQAHICQMVRSMIKGDIFEGYTLDTLTDDAFSNIECPGPADLELQICAATGAPSSQKYGWNIMLDSSLMKIRDGTQRPKTTLEQKSLEIVKRRGA